MAALLGVILYTYISLVFLVTHRICMMQCNPMSRPGVYQGDMGDIRFSGSHVEGDGSSYKRREQPNVRHIRFEPSYLDFHEHSVGMPSIQTVKVINPHTDQSLQLQSVSGSTAHFHASFFQSKVVQPLGNTTFEIVFLARLVGNVENTLFIHTSKGVYPYQVFGVGVPNPYRLRPFLGARVPLNFSFSTLINMHNPYDSPLQVMEMYSSGVDLQLELPSGLVEAPQKHWEIPPYETKALMRVSFVGRVAMNHTAFIRIKASQPAPNQELLILPVEVEVTTAPGLFSSTDMLDFGTLRTMDEPKSIGLYLLNAGHKQVHISAMTVDPPNSALSISFTPALLKPGSKYVKIATATYSAYHVKRNKQANGKVVIKTNSKVSPRLEIPYQVNILQGTIAYSVSKTRFFVGKPPFFPVIRELPITNTFTFNMIIYDAAFPSEVEDVFSIVNFTKPAVIAPQKTVTPFYIQFHANGSDMALSTILRVYTNASIFTVPIHCYDGKLKYFVDGLEDLVEYGTVGTGENRTKSLRIFNFNPIEVTILSIACNLEFARIKVLEIKSNNDSTQLRGNQVQAGDQAVPEDSKVSIKPGYVGLFGIEVAIPKKEGQYKGEIEMTTDFETLHIPIHLKSMDGKLLSSPTSIIFQPAFPGRTINHTLTLYSSFSHTLKVVSITPYPADVRFFFEPHSSEMLLFPNQRLEVGQLFFDPTRGCRTHCYVGIGAGKSDIEWVSSLSLPPNIGEFDGQLIEKHQEMYSSIERSGKNKLNISFIIDTDVVKGFHVPTKASVTWPSLSPDKPVKFPLTHLGNCSTKFFTLENPADVSVVAHVVPLSLYPQLQGVWDVLADRFDTDAYGFDPEESTFTVPSATLVQDDLSDTPASVVSGDLSVVPAPGTLVTLLRPRSTVSIPIQFQPKDERLRTSVILIRNNLTILDGLVVQGQGARGEFTLNGKRPGIHSTLLFEIKPSQLTDCHIAAPRSRTLSSLSVMKTVTATNPGQLAMFVSSLSINGYECEGYGFKIMNCKSFILKPNTSRKIEITFTPDFTMSRVTRKLEVKTTLGPVMEFTLVATIPTHLLPLCSSVLGRNSWEPVVQGVAVVLMGMVFLAVVIAAYAEARRLVFLSHPEMQLLQMRKEEQGTPVFDLNSIAGVKKNKTPVREEPTLGSRRPKKETREAREASPVTSDKTCGSSNNTGAGLTSNLQTNNNIKNIAGGTTRQDANVNRSRNTKAELLTRNQPNSVESTENQARKSSSPLVEPSDSCTRRLNSQNKDSGKSKNSPESRIRNSQDTVLESASSRVNETKRSDQRTTDEGDKLDARNKISSFGAAEAEVTTPASSNKCELAPKESVKVRESSKELKGKQKKKTKVISRKGEKDQRLKNKESPVAKDREDDGAMSDDSCSDGSSDKSVPEVSIQQPAKDTKGPRRRSLPSDASFSGLTEGQNVSKPMFRAATTESIDTRKEKGKTRKNQTTPDGVGSKTKKSENQSQSSNARPKTLDVSSSKGQTGGQTSKNQNSSNTNSPDSGKPNELRGPSPTSPHAIAAAVMSLALGKSMQASSKENNFDDQEKTNKAYTKSSALSPALSDSPPPMSPTSLSGSSRSSSYSSIVSSDGSNGVEQVKVPGMKSNKVRVKSTKSAPMEGRASPPWSSRGSSGSRKSFKPMDDFGLSFLRRSRWGMSLDSAMRPVSPRSPVGERTEVLSSHYLPSTRPSLLEHPPLARGVSQKQNREVRGKVRPFDLNDLGLSDSSAVRRRSYQTGHPTIWKSSQENCYENPESLFSAPSRVADEHFPARNVRRSNNWVNFLDASNPTSGVVTSNKSMAEIWDAGNSPLDSDGWSVYSPVPPSSTSESALSSEANAVDALFSHLPAEWSSASPESPFSTQEITWTPPPDVPSIWGGGYLGCSTSVSLPTSPNASYVSFPVQPQREANQGPLPSTCTFEPLGTLGSSIWNPSAATPAWSPPSE